MNQHKNFINLRRAINNSVNPHRELNGKTPAKMAEINLDLGRNKILKLIGFIAKI